MTLRTTIAALIIGVTMGLLAACQTTDKEASKETTPPVEQTPEPVASPYLPPENTPYTIQLRYDSVSQETVIRSYHAVYFSDSLGSSYAFLHYYDSPMDGYWLLTDEGHDLHKGQWFTVEWEHNTYVDDNGPVGEIKHITLIDPANIPGRTVAVHGIHDLIDACNNALAGDTILIEPGIYDVPYDDWLHLRSDYVTIRAKDGVYLRAHFDETILMISGYHVTVDNLNMTHLFSGEFECGGAVLLASGANWLTVRNCDLNGCGAYGVEAHMEEVDGLLTIENTVIHNNSGTGVLYGRLEFGDALPEFIWGENNELWNNGFEKTDEPYDYRVAYTFGLSDSLQRLLESQAGFSGISHHEQVVDEPLPYFWDVEGLKLGYINPARHVADSAKGMLIYDRFMPLSFIDSAAIMGWLMADTLPSKQALLIYADPVTLQTYYNEGGEDWGYFNNLVAEYFASLDVEVMYYEEATHLALVDSLMETYPEMDEGMGYLFMSKRASAYIPHDQTDVVIEFGETFFKREKR